MKKTGKFICSLPILLVSYLAYGYTLSIAWGWFLVPVLGLPAIGVAHGIGITMTVGLITKNLPKLDEHKSYMEQLSGAFIADLLRCAMILIIGIIVKAFI